MTIKLLPEAVADIEDGFDYLTGIDPISAQNMKNAVTKSLRLISGNPNVGRPGKSPDIREWSVPNWPYVIPYRVVGGDVEVLRVWHTRRNRPEGWG